MRVRDRIVMIYLGLNLRRLQVSVELMHPAAEQAVTASDDTPAVANRHRDQAAVAA